MRLQRPIRRAMRPVTVLLIALLGTPQLGCAGRSFRAALREDSAAAYHRFLRLYPGASRAAEAQERLDFTRVRGRPSPEAFEAFRAKYPMSPLLGELRDVVEDAYFARAQAAGSAHAYREFLAEFPAGAQARRALGNATYLEEGGYGLDGLRLARFAQRHADSDFAPEAGRSARALGERRLGGFRRLALAIDVAPGTPEADRLRRVFRQRAERAWAGSGVELVEAEGEGAALLAISHREQPVGTELAGGRMARPGLEARTRVRVTLRTGRGSAPEEIFSREFSLRAKPSELREGESMLFAPGSERYWQEFFVPRPSWRSDLAARRPHPLPGPVVSVHTAGPRALVLHRGGSFRLMGLADPERPEPLAEYRRPADHRRFTGALLAPGRALLFGPDGLELVALEAEGTRRLGGLDRDALGSIDAVARVGDQWLAAGRRGLFRVDPARLVEGAAAVERLVDRPIPGLAALGERAVFTDGTSLFVASVEELRARRVDAELHLGRGFGPRRVRVQEGSALVLGERGLLRVELSGPGPPRVVSRIEDREAGGIRDAVALAGRVFLLGQRGLQLLDASGERVVDAVDVAARGHLAAMGRHLVLVGEGALQVVDALPLLD